MQFRCVACCFCCRNNRDVKRGQTLEAEVEAEARTSRLRVETEAEAKFKEAEQNNVLIE